MRTASKKKRSLGQWTTKGTPDLHSTCHHSSETACRPRQKVGTHYIRRGAGVLRSMYGRAAHVKQLTCNMLLSCTFCCLLLVFSSVLLEWVHLTSKVDALGEGLILRDPQCALHQLKCTTGTPLSPSLLQTPGPQSHQEHNFK